MASMGQVTNHDILKVFIPGEIAIARRLSMNGGVNLQAQMHWRKLRINLWRFVQRKNKNLIEFIIRFTNVRSVLPHYLPYEIVERILSNLSTDELIDLMRQCVPAKFTKREYHLLMILQHTVSMHAIGERPHVGVQSIEMSLRI